MIKNFAELSENEKERLIDFALPENADKGEDRLVREELKKRYGSEDYDFGKGILAKLENDKIQWKVSMVLKEAGYKDIGYVMEYLCNKDSLNPKRQWKEMIAYTQMLAKEYGLKELLFGTSEDEVKAILAEEGYSCLYRGVRMVLKDYEIRYPLLPQLTLLPLSCENKDEYLAVFNNAFLDVPNGATLTETKVQEYVDKNQSTKKYFLAKHGRENIGFVQFDIGDTTGEFDLGVKKELQGRGLGMCLLETAINFLIEKNVQNIELTVMSGNTKAMEMYKKRGFLEKEYLGSWYQIGEAYGH